MKCKYGQSGTCEKLFRPNCPDDDTCYEFEMFTNADHIRSMTDEELAKFIPNWSYTNACKCDEASFVDCNNECEGCVADWLKQPYKEETT